MSRGRKERPLPANVDAERAVLGCMLLNPDSFRVVGEILGGSPSSLFIDGRHQVIYSAVLELEKKNVSLDSVTIVEMLMKKSRLEDAGGVSYIAELTSAVPTSANAEHYARIVAEASNLRSIIEEAQKLIESAYSPEGSAEEMIDEFNLCMAMRVQNEDPANITSVEDMVETVVERIEKIYKTGNVGGVPTGISRLDVIFRGFRKGELTVVAAAPSVGKTAFALNIISNMAMRGYRSLVFSMEMPKEDLVQRVIYQRGQISEHRVLSKHIPIDELGDRLRMAVGPEMKNISIDDTMSLSVKQICSRIRKYVAARKIDLVVIDYLQLIDSQRAKGESRAEEIGRITRKLKNIAGELRIPVLLLSQVSREGAKSEELQLYHLRESGDIEAHANNVLMLWRGEDKIINCAIRKQRNGPIGKADLIFDRAIQMFRDYTPEDGEEMRKKSSSKKDDVDELLGISEEPSLMEPIQEEIPQYWDR